MTINDNVSFGKISNTDINGRCIPPVVEELTNNGSKLENAISLYNVINII